MPEDEPPEPFAPETTDPGTRKYWLELVEARLDGIEAHVENFNSVVDSKLGGYVSHARFTSLAAAVVVAIVGAAWVVAQTAATDTKRAVQAELEPVKKRVEDVRQDAEGWKKEMKEDMRSLYDYLRTRRRQPGLERADGEREP